MSDEGGRMFVGIDWATETPQVTVLDQDGKLLAERTIAHTAEGLAKMCDWLGDFDVPLAQVRVAIEVPHGAVVETLLERELAVYSINPRQLDRFRDRFSMSGAKDDRRDALVLADSLRTDAHCFRRLSLAPESMIVLREWSRMAEDLSDPAHQHVGVPSTADRPPRFSSTSQASRRRWPRPSTGTRWPKPGGRARR